MGLVLVIGGLLFVVALWIAVSRRGSVRVPQQAAPRPLGQPSPAGQGVDNNVAGVGWGTASVTRAVAPVSGRPVLTGLVDVPGILQISNGVRLIPDDDSLAPMPLALRLVNLTSMDIKDGDKVHIYGSWYKRRVVRVKYLRNKTTNVAFTTGFWGPHTDHRPRVSIGHAARLRGVVHIDGSALLLTPSDDLIPRMALNVGSQTASQLVDGDVVHVYGFLKPHYLEVVHMRNLRTDVLVTKGRFRERVRQYPSSFKW